MSGQDSADALRAERSRRQQRLRSAQRQAKGVKNAGREEQTAAPAKDRRNRSNSRGSARAFSSLRGEHAADGMTGPVRARIVSFLQSVVPDFIIVLVVSAALTYTVSYAFNSAPLFRANILLIALLSAPLLIALYVGTWSKKALLPSAIAAFVIAACIVGGFLAIMPSGVEIFVPMESWSSAAGINDVEDNYVIFAFTVAVIPIVVFLLSRRAVGSVVLLIIAMFACGMVQFLYRDWITEQPGLVASMVVLMGSVMLFIYQTYRQSVYSAKRAQRTSFFGIAGFSGVVALVCVLVGLGVFYGAVSAFDFETLDIRPFEHRAAAPIDDKAERLEDVNTEGEDETSETNDEREETKDNKEEGGQSGDSSPSGSSPGSRLLGTPVGQLVQAVTGFDPTDSDQDFEEISYLILALTAAIAAILVLLIAIAAVTLWRSMRKRRLRKIADKPIAYRIGYIYEFLIERLERLKIGKPAHLTPLEYAIGFEQALAPFARGAGGADFLDVTRIYMDACWGDVDVNEEDYSVLEAFYLAFFKNAREQVGWPKWLAWKFWRI